MTASVTRRFRNGIVAALLLSASTFFVVGCGGDDPVAPPVDLGTNKVTFMHVNPDQNSREIIFFRDSVQLTTGMPKYGEFFTQEVPNGSSLKYILKLTSGTPIDTVTTTYDSTQSVMILYAGSNASEDGFAAVTKKITTSTGKAAIRFVHAAKDGTARSLKVGDPNGSVIASNISYKGASGAYTSITVTGMDTLYIVDDTGVEAPIAVPVNLTVAPSWTIVFHGKKDALTADLKWKGTPVADPE